MKHKKRKLLAGAVLVLGLSMSVYGTTAYFNADATAHNVITMGNVKIDLQEWADKENEIKFTNIPNAMPGGSYDKLVEVTNTGTQPAYVRVQVEKTIEMQDKSQGNLDYVTMDFNQQDWTLGNDGYYYYKRILQPEETTEPLFRKVTLAKEMGNAYQKADIHVNVMAFATQSANQVDDEGNQLAPWAAQGWPENTNGNDSQNGNADDPQSPEEPESSDTQPTENPDSDQEQPTEDSNPEDTAVTTDPATEPEETV